MASEKFGRTSGFASFEHFRKEPLFGTTGFAFFLVLLACGRTCFGAVGTLRCRGDGKWFCNNRLPGLPSSWRIPVKEMSRKRLPTSEI